MNFILNIETATTVCSVSISQNEKILFYKEINEGYTHAENLHLFIVQALEETKLKANQLTAIGVSKGPGSYTGLRIGVSAAKGLAYALKIPLISVDTLRIMVEKAYMQKKEKAFYCPMIDARRMEVYTCMYDEYLNPVTSIEALVVDSNSLEKFGTYPKLYFFGNGMPKCRSLLETTKNAAYIDGIYPSANSMTDIIYRKFLKKDFEDLAYFEPFYLKDFMISAKKLKN